MRARTVTLGIVLGVAVLTGCGIRPTAVPVDAGAPASRTACPSPLHVPEAVTATRTPAPVLPSPHPSAHPTPSASKSPESPFGASPSPAHCP